MMPLCKATRLALRRLGGSSAHESHALQDVHVFMMNDQKEINNMHEYTLKSGYTKLPKN